MTHDPMFFSKETNVEDNDVATDAIVNELTSEYEDEVSFFFILLHDCINHVSFFFSSANIVLHKFLSLFPSTKESEDPTSRSESDDLKK